MNEQDTIITNIQPDINVPLTAGSDAVVENVLTTVFLVAAGLSLLFLAIGGLKYVLSQGEPQKTQEAKEGIIYAIVGLVISLSAFAIVSFVYRSLIK